LNIQDPTFEDADSNSDFFKIAAKYSVFWCWSLESFI